MIIYSLEHHIMTNNYHLGFLFIVVVIVVGPSPCLHTVEAFSTVVYGPAMSTIELVLLTSKLSAKEGHNSYCVCAPGQETKYTTLMYGSSSSKKHAEEEKNDDANTNDDAAAGTAATTNRAIPVSSSEDIQTALLEADALILACYDTPLEEKALNTLLETATAEGNDNLSQVVLISKMGVTQQANGFFGGGNKNKKLLDAETMIRSVCATKSTTIQKTIEVAIVRAGPLKGGGPGQPATNDFGLSKNYYNTLYELSEASCTMAHDRFSLGVVCTPGDTVPVPNPVIQLGTKTSFDARASDTNRITIAQAAVFLASSSPTNTKKSDSGEDGSKNPKPVEFSIGCSKGTEPLSNEEWNNVMNAAMEI